jgi:hypothetical protein
MCLKINQFTCCFSENFSSQVLNTLFFCIKCTAYKTLARNNCIKGLILKEEEKEYLVKLQHRLSLLLF